MGEKAMRIVSMIVVWVYILLATILEVVASYVIPAGSWVLRDTVLSIIAISMAAGVVMFYM